MTRQHKLAGILFIVLGVYVTLYSFIKLDVGSLGAPGSGFFTLLCGLGIFVLSSLWLISGLRQQADPTPLWGKLQWLKPFIAVGITIIYAILMASAGYILSTAAFIVLWQIVIAKAKTRTIIIFSLVGTVAMYLVFKVLLSVPLSNGILGI
jgi:hypothetical protein